ncbi:hypothetical protein LguiB_006080 [Lonicera macranthoides]
MDKSLGVFEIRCSRPGQTARFSNIQPRVYAHSRKMKGPPYYHTTTGRGLKDKEDLRSEASIFRNRERRFIFKLKSFRRRMQNLSIELDKFELCMIEMDEEDDGVHKEEGNSKRNNSERHERSNKEGKRTDMGDVGDENVIPKLMEKICLQTEV